MKKMLAGVLLACLFSVFFAGGQAILVPAQDEIPVGYSIYARIDGIDGEATDENHKGWIEIDSMNFGVHVPESGATGQSRRRGSVIVEDITMTKEIDKASPKIAEDVCTGRTVEVVELEIMAPGLSGPRLVVRYELENVVIKGFWHEADTEDGLWDAFTLSYEGITMTYTEYDEQGKPVGDTEWKYVNQE